MNVLDANVLVALFVNDHPHHSRARVWWSGPGAESGLVVPDLAWVAFPRIITHPRALPTRGVSAPRW